MRASPMKRLLPLLCLCVCMAASARERYALLVGVAALPALPAANWLSGPPRDVAAMRAALLQQGFSDAHIVSLGSGASDVQLPTRAAILGRLDQLARTLAADDVLVLYWSGQALQLPGFAGQPVSPLGQGVQLLTRDSRVGADGHALVGGVSGAEIGRAIDAIGARHAQMVAVFDTCHAATLNAAAAVKTATARAAGVLAKGAANAASNAAAGAFAGIEARPHFIGFYASQTQPGASAEHPSADAAGPFTRAVIAALRGTPENYQGWARATALHYRAALSALHLPASRWRAPASAGALDAPLWQAVATPHDALIATPSSR